MREAEISFNVHDPSEVTIATLASHSSLQIIHGARKEGFRTALVLLKDRESFYREFGHLIDEFIIVEKWEELCSNNVERKLKESNSIFVPHGSLIEYVGLRCAEKLKVPYFGSRNIFKVEANQHEKMHLLQLSGIPIPKLYRLNDEIDRPVIVKLPGAKGGRGYFVASSKEELQKGLSKFVEAGLIHDVGSALIQEYVVGTPAYFHFFYSPVYGRVEILGMDIRYESNADGIKRVPHEIAVKLELQPSFVVVGNIPMVLRESLLPKALEYGKKFVEASRSYAPPGIIGPFSLESIIRETLEIVVFEFSGRIVAGTNLYINGSPYSWLYFDEPMSVGRRIAREIRMAIEKNKLELVLS